MTLRPLSLFPSGTRELDGLLRRVTAWAPRATVVYHRADGAGKGFAREQGDGWERVGTNASRPAVAWVCGRIVKHPCARVDAIEDAAFLRDAWPRVLTTDAVLPRARARGAAAAGELSWNAAQNSLLAWSDCFVSVQGGGSYLASFFGGHNIVVNFFGRAYGEPGTEPPPLEPAAETPQLLPPRRRRLAETGFTYDTVLPRLSNQTLVEVTSARQLYHEIDRWRALGVCGL